MVKELQRCVPGRASQVDKPELLKDGTAEEQGEIYLVAACREVGTSGAVMPGSLYVFNPCQPV